ncbi:MAG: hypothetical protein L0154_11230 [Chloroflexi bacterium]|nr:hypothetical protein [Chloroflexota bacterium]
MAGILRGTLFIHSIIGMLMAGGLAVLRCWGVLRVLSGEGVEQRYHSSNETISGYFRYN